MICLFLAILEMVRMQAVQLVQEEQFGDIGLKRHHKFEELFGSEQALAARHGARELLPQRGRQPGLDGAWS